MGIVCQAANIAQCAWESRTRAVVARRVGANLESLDLELFLSVEIPTVQKVSLLKWEKESDLAGQREGQ